MEVDPVRLIVSLEPEAEEAITSTNSGTLVRGLFYRALARVDERLATQLHDANTKKPFSLTGLRARERFIDEAGLLHLKPPVYFMFATPYSVLAEKFVDGLEKLGEFEIPATRYRFSAVKVYPIRDTKIVRTKTPALFRAANGRHYFEVGEEGFATALRYSVTVPVKDYGGEVQDYSIRLVEKKIVTYDGKKVPGHYIEFRADGDTAILKGIGLGNHSQEGFGFLVE